MNGGVCLDAAFGQGEVHLRLVAEERHTCLLLFTVAVRHIRIGGDIIATERNVLRRRHDRSTTGRAEYVQRRHHQ